MGTKFERFREVALSAGAFGKASFQVSEIL